jgi:HSP20 family protein
MTTTIDETIERVEHLYTALTGLRPPTTGRRAPIPPETDPILHVQDQLCAMVDAVERIVPSSASSAPAWVPRALAWVHESDLVLAIDVPGVLARDLQIRVEPFALVVSGRRRAPWARTPQAVPACDAPLGTFARSFPLPGRVGADQIGARLDDGVLTIRVRPTPRTEPSQIPIT